MCTNLVFTVVDCGSLTDPTDGQVDTYSEVLLLTPVLENLVHVLVELMECGPQSSRTVKVLACILVTQCLKKFTSTE